MLWTLKSFSDLTIVVGKKEIQVHKSVVASQSSVFAAMMMNDEQFKTTNKLEIKDYSEEAVEDFLRDFYTNEFESTGNALELFSLASNFNVIELKTVYEKMVISSLNEGNALTALKLGNLHESLPIVEAAFYKIKKIIPDPLKKSFKFEAQKIEEILEKFLSYKMSLE